MKHTKKFAMLITILIVIIAGCSNNTNNNSGVENEGQVEEGSKLKDITVVLDWLPNTNHTGLYVAKEKGYYEEEGLNVEIITPGEGSSADTTIAAGNAEFGVSFQEGVTQARVGGVPIVSIAAVIQHNTSGFASPVSKNITSPKDFEGKVYGGWGNPVEEAVIASLMKAEGADVEKVEILNSGYADFFTATERDVDFQWIFYGWDGIQAELRDYPINMIFVNELSDQLDYYTPVLITSESMIADQPEVVEAFMAATAKGYQFAIDTPEEAAEVLLAAVPDLDEEQVKASQEWLSPRYQDDAVRWGEQKKEVWENYANWMLEHELLEGELDVDKAFTNEFLPE